MALPDLSPGNPGATFSALAQWKAALDALGINAADFQAALDRLTADTTGRINAILQGLADKATNEQLAAVAGQIYAAITAGDTAQADRLTFLAQTVVGKADNTQLNSLSLQLYTAIGQEILARASGDAVTVNRIAEVAADLAALQLVLSAAQSTAQAATGAVLPREGSRPGTVPALFVPTLADGDVLKLPAIPDTMVVDGDNGSVARMIGAGMLADRALRSLEPSRRYRARIVVQRRVDSPDPSNDTVRLGIAWYNRSGLRLVASGAQSNIAVLTDLRVADGRKEILAMAARSAAATVTHVAPYGARYARLYVQTYGTDCQTDIEVMSWDDATALESISPDLSAFRADLDGVVSQNLGLRVGVLENTVGTPAVLRYGTRGDAIAATIPLQIDLVETLGFTTRGDGGGAIYRRSGSGAAPGKFKSADGAWWELTNTFATPLQYGAKANGVSDDSAAIAVGRQIDLLPQDYAYRADKLDVSKLGRVPRQARLRSVRAGDNMVRDRRSGAAAGIAFNHREEICYTGTYPRMVPANPIVSGNLEAPPISTADAAGPVDIIAHWYGDWGLDFYRRATGIAGPSFDGWYDGRWNATSSPGYDPKRHSILGHYRNDDPQALDWQCYWLREAGIKAVIPVAFDFNIDTWGDAGDRNLWIYRLFNAPNFQGLTYIPWARTTNFDTPDGAVTASAAEILHQWQNLYFGLARAFPNNYVMNYGGKRFFTVYCWNSQLLGAVFDPGGGAVNFMAWLKLRADDVKSIGYDGICILSHNAIPAIYMDRDALLANGVLYLDSPYGGPSYSSASAADYAGLLATFNPPSKGAVINVATSLQSQAPISVFNYPGSTPALFASLLQKAIEHVNRNTNLPRALTVYNVAEWAEGGASLHPTVGNGFGYLDAVRFAASRVALRGGLPLYKLALFANWSPKPASPPVCWRDSEGHVHLDGLMTGGYGAADGTTILTVLPEGHRPAGLVIRQVVLSDGKSSAISIDENGYLRAYAPLDAVQTCLAITPFRAA